MINKILFLTNFLWNDINFKLNLKRKIIFIPKLGSLKFIVKVKLIILVLIDWLILSQKLFFVFTIFV